MSEIFYVDSRGNRLIGEIPNECPVCHRIAIIKNLQNYRHVNDVMQCLFECPNNSCGSLFIGYYRVGSISEMSFISCSPQKIQIPNFPESIEKVSPNFISIYCEAEDAKQLGLLQIAGPGFRKAFEFLIKDYAKVSSKENKIADIEKLPASSVVKNYIPDPRIQNVAKRALWLGNDETHYLRKWENHDIKDLLTLINLTINWIEIEQLSSSYAEEMPE